LLKAKNETPLEVESRRDLAPAAMVVDYVVPAFRKRLRSCHLPPVRICLFDILVDVGLETFQRIPIPTEVELTLVNSEGVRTLWLVSTPSATP
jgi:hypothetical protein